MTESEEVSGRKRRSSAEIKRLVTEFQSSGLRQNESGGLVAVELSGQERTGKDRSSSALEVVLSGGRRIEVRPGFDSNTLERLLGVLERE